MTPKKIVDRKKREFLKKGVFGLAAGAAAVALSKMPFVKAGGVIDEAELKNYSETAIKENTGATYTIDMEKGNVFELTLTANCTFIFSKAPVSGKAGSFTLILKQDSTGSRTVTWPAAVDWVSGKEPTLTTDPDMVDIFSFVTTDGGARWYGGVVGEDMGENPRLYAWGNNVAGELGDGTVTDRHSPVQIGSLTDWSSITTSSVGRAIIAVKTDNTLWACGLNTDAQLGDGTVLNRSSPVQIGTLTDWASVEATGELHGGAIKTDGTLWTWGKQTTGALGDGTVVARSSPVQIGTSTDWSIVVGGAFQSIAIKTDGTLWSWGRANFGALGDNTTVNKSSPVQIGSDTDWASVSSGSDFSLVIKTGNTLWAWGDAGAGRIGDNQTSSNRSSPVQIGALTDWSSVSAGSQNGVAIKTDGTLWTWGRGSSGELGDGTAANKSSPVQVGSDTDWSSVSAGRLFCLAIKTDGTLWAWGDNAPDGQLGQGDTVERSSPTQVGSFKTWAKIGTGTQHSIAIKNSEK